MTPDAVLHLLLTYKYFILVPLAVFEGPVTCILVGFLASLGLMNPWLSFGVMALGDFLPDSVYYIIGRRMREGTFVRRFGSKIGITDEHLLSIENLWRKHTLKSMVFSKWAYGLSTPLLMTAGLSHVPALRFILLIIPLILFQDAVLIFVGYHFGSYYNLLAESIHFAGYIVTGLLICAVVAYISFSRYMKHKFLAAQHLHPPA